MQILKNSIFLYSLFFSVNAQLQDDNNLPRPGDDRPVPPQPVPVVTSTTSSSSTTTTTSETTSVTATDDSKPTNSAKSNSIGALGLVSFFAYAVL